MSEQTDERTPKYLRDARHSSERLTMLTGEATATAVRELAAEVRASREQLFGPLQEIATSLARISRALEPPPMS